ncbi:MAG: SDR family oxidoreductase [Clostridia bacterium]|nr:SDR family oxidoreductase [Clostridia bacterium]MBR6726978.1 SDR family oxidoreductase [Clostridia bacterium]
MNSWLDLEGKSIIVTGAASGIGLACAQELLNDGANVTVCDIAENAPALDEGKGKLLYVRTDVTSKASVDAMIAKVVETFGGIDVIVNNAGINIPRLLVDEGNQFELDEAVWDKVMNVNVKGLFFCSQAAGRVMLKAGKGVIINMSSECGLEGSEGQSVYAASKNAVNALTRSWAKELGKKNIRVVGVAPGILEATGLRTISYETALAYTRGITVDQLRAGYSKTGTTPLGRSGKLSEVANLVAFLASDRASYIHGVTINVAGGKTRG